MGPSRIETVSFSCLRELAAYTNTVWSYMGRRPNTERVHVGIMHVCMQTYMFVWLHVRAHIMCVQYMFVSVAF